MRIFTAGICRTSPRTDNDQTGLTLIELVVAMLLVLIIVGVMTAGFGRFGRGQNLKTAVAQLIWQLRTAAEQAKTGAMEVRLYFNGDTGIYEVWKLEPDSGSPNLAGDEATSALQAVMVKQIVLPEGITIAGVTLDSSENDDQTGIETAASVGIWPETGDYLGFNRDGTATAGKIELDRTDDATRYIQVDASGRVREVVADGND
jgi:type II secretory pathway pseudopilin PulG